ncbi:type II toxin-antitoxin system VapC family toxin [Candidatus Woesearchaeota archaeon]|nr:type II toxin-antitoxin system VapC family toxin [Candidatus Woesearchaeota archaeon]
MTVLLDSWAWVEYFKDGAYAETISGYVEGEEEIIISSITVAEVLRYLLQFESKEMAELLTKVMIKRSIIAPVTEDIAWDAGEFKHQHKWGLGDSIIYATAQTHNATVVTGDADFKDAKGVIYLGK